MNELPKFQSFCNACIVFFSLNFEVKLRAVMFFIVKQYMFVYESMVIFENSVNSLLYITFY